MWPTDGNDFFSRERFLVVVQQLAHKAKNFMPIDDDEFMASPPLESNQ